MKDTLLFLTLKFVFKLFKKDKLYHHYAYVLIRHEYAHQLGKI